IAVLLDLTSPDAVPLLRMLENMKLSAMGKELAITVFAMNEEKTADAIMKELGRFSFDIALDNRLKMRNVLAENISLFPYAVLAKNGVVQWGGIPTELELVTEKVLKGNFSLEKQLKVEGLRKELQIAIQSGLPVVVSSTADKILAVLPDDRLAIQSKLFALNAMRQKEDAEKFMEKVCRENPGDVRLKIMQMDLLLREGKREPFVQKVDQGYNDLKESGDLLLFVSFVLEQVPFGMIVPEKQILLASAAYKNSRMNGNTPDEAVKALSAEVYAKALSMAGRFREAVRYQQEAVAARKGGKLENAAKALLAYYQAALSASEKEKNKGK
ncbi:MAG: hypothetical protein IKA79_07585, partial [Lentisphaeria bacterium]|nr:hypothetical protein [Lentisphaeria bacterium]